MSKRRAPQRAIQGKRPKGSASSTSRIIDDDDDNSIQHRQPKDIRYTNIMSTVTASGVRTHRTAFTKAPASPVKTSVRSEEYDSAFDFTGNLFGSVREPEVVNHDFSNFSAAFAEEFPTENSFNSQEKKKRVRHLEDHPLLRWTEHSRPKYLHEIIRLEGRGSFLHCKICTACRKSGSELYRCQDCLSHGRLVCADCMIYIHESLPFHNLEHWTGNHFERASLKKLGLRIQLGHPYGEKCLVPTQPYNDDFVIIDVNGVHEVGLNFCGCQVGGPRAHDIQLLRASLYPSTGVNPRTAATFTVLKNFHLLSFESKLSGYEYVKAIERLTSNGDIEKSRDRYDEFMRMIRQWRSLKQLKRAGRGHDPAGIAATQPGECALLCPACPQPNINLPVRWEFLDEDKQWLYTLFLGIDGNFKLKRKRVSSDEQDPGLSDGWGYMVEEKVMKAHLAKNWDYKQERSTCVNHNAVNNADKEARGLATSGAITVDCIRHDFKRPNGVGDLQKGERYINTDFVFFSSIRSSNIKRIAGSYNISCQWGKNIDARVLLLPEHLRWPPSVEALTLFVPKFHIGAHDLICNLELSFNITPGVGRTDGEAPERGWSNINPLANSTKEMGPGSRRDTLDDHFGDWNWKKIIKMGDSLYEKLVKAIPESHKQREILADFEEGRPEVIPIWRKEVEAWERDRKNPNPYAAKVKRVSERDVRLELARDAAKTLASERQMEKQGAAPASALEVHPSTVIAIGLELEELQRQLKVDVTPLSSERATAKQLTDIIERSNRLRLRIASWIDLQAVHMPEAMVARENTARVSDSEAEAVDGIAGVSAHNISLWLPSSLAQKTSRTLRVYEWKLRHGQAHDALHDIRHHLRLRSALWHHKKHYSHGVAQNTRSAQSVEACQAKINKGVRKYTSAWDAMTVLKDSGIESSLPHGWDRYVRELKPEDVRGLADGLMGDSEGTRTMSWIWRAEGGAMSDIENPKDWQDDPGLNEALKIEWCKLRARAMRWEEEVELLQEEMRRTEVFFKWRSNWWISRGQDMDTDDETVDGLMAYAASQSKLWQGLRERCWERWAQMPSLFLAQKQY